MRVRLNAAKKQFDIFSQARKGAVKGAGEMRVRLNAAKNNSIFLHNPVMAALGNPRSPSE